jgi:mycothiol synthase
MAIAMKDTGHVMMGNLPDGFRMRPARTDDLQTIIELLNTGSKQLFGKERFKANDFKTDWSTPHFDLERDTQVVETQDGRLVGYYDIFDLNEPHVRVYGWGQVHPDAGKDIGRALLSWVEQRARQAILLSPAEARVVLVVHAPTIDHVAEDLCLEAGYHLARYYLRMVIDLNAPIPQPEWPEGINLRTFVMGEDDCRVVQAVRDSFSDHYGHVEKPFDAELEEFRHYYQTKDDFDPSLYFLAMDGEEVAAISLCQPTTDDDPEMGWVHQLGVRRPWRRQGLALALLRHSFREFHHRGRLRAGLGVDALSLTGANHLYTKAGMCPEPLWQISGFEKELRPGIELSTQSIG